MESTFGCLKVIGVVAALSLSTGMEAEAQIVCYDSGGSGSNATDTVSNYATEGNCATGTQVCLGAIADGIECAKKYFNTEPSGNFTLTVGDGTVASPQIYDFTHDGSLSLLWQPTTDTFHIASLGNAAGGSCTSSPQSGLKVQTNTSGAISQINSIYTQVPNFTVQATADDLGGHV